MYQIYPTLLDAFVRYKKSGEYAEAEDAYKNLIDKINRVPQPETEEMQRGKHVKLVIDAPENSSDFVIGNQFFNYDERALLLQIRESMRGSVYEVFTTAMLPTQYGYVRLYGYVDNVLMDAAYDVKYTGRYELGKYYNSTQRLIYPFCLNANGATINTFTFIATDLAKIYWETYGWRPGNDIPILTTLVEEFIRFLHQHKADITDKKIFGQEPVEERDCSGIVEIVSDGRQRLWDTSPRLRSLSNDEALPF